MSVDDKACIIFLQGELGSGKTTLVRGFLQGKGYAGKVKSPSYTLLETYACDPMSIVHVDLYRLNDAREVENISLRDYLDANTIVLIEWPEKAAAKLPPADLLISLTVLSDSRKIDVQATTTRGQEILRTLSLS